MPLFACAQHANCRELCYDYGKAGAHAHAIGGELIEETADVLVGGVEPRLVIHLVEKSECSDGILISLRFNLTRSPLSFNIPLVQRQSFA